MPVKPWLTEEYAKELHAQHAKDREENPWTEEMSKKHIAAAGEVGTKAKLEREAKIKEIGKYEFIKEQINLVKIHIEELKNPTPEERYKHTDDYFNDIIESMQQVLESYETMIAVMEPNSKLLKIPPTKYPKRFITNTDKVSLNLFLGEFNEELQSLKMEGRNSKKELTTKVNIDFNELENISISRELSPYDREVHDSIVSLNIDGGNEYITPLMVYRTMTGNTQAKLNPKQQEAISDSVSRCSFTRIRIDATGEAKAYGMDKAIYEGNLLYTEKVTVHHKGNVSEWIRLLREPVLYEYASSKNQIGRLEIKLLNTPTNKNEETIILQGYLQRRILSMKGSMKLSRNIRYETIYRYLGIPEEQTAAIRNKKSFTRKAIADIFGYWKENNWINGYDENKEGTTIASITISI